MLPILLPFIVVLPATVYILLSLWCAHRFFKGQGARGKEQETANILTLDPGPLTPDTLSPGITILKPVKGMDADSYENFASFCRQDYSGARQMIFAAASLDDPVIAVITRLIGNFPDLDISLIINPAIHGPNYKVSNLINAYSRARYDVIIICDSDIRVSRDYLQSVTSHFASPQVGLVTSLYRTSAVHGIATALEASGFTTEMIPNVLVALRLEGLSFALGASMAVRREALASIGGLEVLADYLADDYQLGNKIHCAGWEIELDSCFVESIIKTDSMMSILTRQLRWARTMRISRPGGYLASGITLPFPAAFLALIAAPSLSIGAAAVLLLYGIRLAASTRFSQTYVKDRLLPQWFWILPLRDMLSFFSWALSFLGNQVEWRGSRFRLKPGGKIEEIV